MPRSVIITGGRGALASAIAGAFTSEGWDAAAPGRDELDVTDPQSVSGYFRGRVPDLLICAAGKTRDAPLARMTESSWDEVISVNLDGAARCARAVLPGMIERKSGHIVFVSSFSALHPPAGQTAYAAAKAGLIGLGKSLAREAGPSGVRVNLVLPGFLETPMTAAVPGARRAEVLAAHALGRFNTAEQAARFFVTLETLLPHTSGQVFQLDSRIS